MATNYIEDPKTGKTIPFEWDSDKPPSDNEINALLIAARGESPKREWSASDVVKEPLKIAADMGAGILNIPVKAAKGIGGLAHFGGQLIRGNGLDAALNKATDFIGDRNVVKSPWESKVLSAAGENVVLPAINKTASVLGTDPSNVSAVLEAGGDIATLLGLGGGIKSPLASAANASGNAVKKTADVATSSLSNLALKQPTKLTKAQRNQNIQTMLEGGYAPTVKGTAKLDADIASLEQQLADGLSAGKSKGLQGTLSRAIDNIDALRQQALASSNPVANIQKIDEAILSMQSHPLLQNGMVDLADLQRMKVVQGKELQPKYANGVPMVGMDDFSTAIGKARVRGLKEELESVLSSDFPELSSVNKDLSKKYQLKKILDAASNRIENSSQLGGLGYKAGVGGMLGNTIPGVGPVVGGALGVGMGVAQNPIIAPKIAGLLNRVNGRQPITYFQPDNMPARMGLMSGAIENAVLRDTQN